MLLMGFLGTAIVASIAGSIAGTVTLLLTAGVALAVLELRRGKFPEVIRAQKIEIVGEDGLTRVALGETLEGAGAVATYDAQGQFVAALDASGRQTLRPRAGDNARSPYSTMRVGAVGATTAVRASQR